MLWSEAVETRSSASRDDLMKFMYSSGSCPLDGYTVKCGIGHGGFGEVYYAVSDGAKEVALKLIQRNLEVELRGVAQCMNLKHPNLVALYDLRTNDSGEHFVVMEYISGRSLAEELEDQPDEFSVDLVKRSIVATHPTGEPIFTANRSYADRASAHHGADEPGLGLASPKSDDSSPLVFAWCRGCGTLYPHPGRHPNCPHQQVLH